MWGWANHSPPAKATDQLYRVERFGEREKLSQSAEPTFVADEGLGWEMAAVATRILEGKGVYRCPSKNGFLFLVFMDICFIDTDRSSESKRAKAREEIACASHTTGFETFVCEHLAQNPSQEWSRKLPRRQVLGRTPGSLLKNTRTTCPHSERVSCPRGT
jgi:hypothetical protein